MQLPSIRLRQRPARRPETKAWSCRPNRDYKAFQVAHASEQESSDRYYLASWALSFDLAFNRKLLGTKQLDDYVHALKRGAKPLERPTAVEKMAELGFDGPRKAVKR